MALLRGKRVLLIEDEPVVALVAEEMLVGLGAEVVGPAGHLDEALALACREPVDMAVLDVNLNGRMSDPVAEALRARAIPFIYATGYGDAASCPLEPGAPIVQKPYTQRDIEHALRRLAV